MSELVVVGFKNEITRASELLDELEMLNEAWVVDLRDAVAVHRNFHGEVKIYRSYRLTEKQGDGLNGALEALIGATLAIAFNVGAAVAGSPGAMAGGARSAALGATGRAIDASCCEDEFGISEDFVFDVGILVGPGSSAIYAILDSDGPGFVAARLRGCGGSILSTTLSDKQQERIEEALYAGHS